MSGWKRVTQAVLLGWAGACAFLALLTLFDVVIPDGSVAALFALPLLLFAAVMVLRIRGTPLNDLRASREVRALWQRADSTSWADLYPS